MTRFVDQCREEFPVEKICEVIEFPPSTYYAAKKRQENPTAREIRDQELLPEIRRVWEEKGRKLYGAVKVWNELRREGIEVARCTVERLMGAHGMSGVVAKRRRPRTTIPGNRDQRPRDLVERDFRAPAPNQLWVTDITYVELACGRFCYAAFVTDAFSRAIVGWKVADTLKAELALDALERRCGREKTRSAKRSCTTAIGVCNTPRFATRNDSSTLESRDPSAEKAIPMITPWRNRSTLSTRKK